MPTIDQVMAEERASAFTKRSIKNAAKLGFEQYDAEQSRYDTSGDRKKQSEVRLKATHKQIEALFKGSASLAEQFAKIAAMEEKEALATLNAQQRGMMQKSVADLEVPALLAAAKAKSPQVKNAFLQMISFSGANYGRSGIPKPKTGTPALTDPAAIEAALALLADESPVSNKWDPGTSSPVSVITAGVIAYVHGDPAHQAEWEKLGMKSARLSKKLSRIHAEAILKKQPLPAMPNAASVSAEKVKAILAELGALQPDKIAPALERKTADEQLALFDHLSELPEWPAALVAAHFTVATSSSEKPGALGDPKWVGRRLDESFINEIRDALTKAVREEQVLQVSVTVGEPLSGVTVNIVSPKSRASVGTEQFKKFAIPGLDGNPPPIGLAGAALTDASQRERYMMNFPVWKEEPQNTAWREKHGKAVPSPESAEPELNKFPTNPAKFEQKLKDFLSLKSAKHRTFRVMFYSAMISDKKVENEADE